MQRLIGTIVGKSIKTGLFFRRHGGHTLPGFAVEKIFPRYLETMLAQLPEGVILITGTNGKTTTTKIVKEILEANGKLVLTNQTGSNLSRGIVSAIVRQASVSGRLNQDLAILEVDEAQARRLVAHIKPRWVLALNVSRDQLDRFGEVDTIASYIGDAMQAATEGIVVNGNDTNLFKLAKTIYKKDKLKLITFGVNQNLANYFPTDYELAAVNRSVKTREKSLKNDVELIDFKAQSATYKIAGKNYKTRVKLTGQHNYLNGAAALALCRQLLPLVDNQELINQLAAVELAFGRGEKYQLKTGGQIELVLVKNPASFTQALSSYSAKNTNLMIAINDNIADGRDVSWLWDVNFGPLAGQKVAITSGKRAADMALRLSYDDINIANIQPDLSKAIKLLAEMNGPKVVLSTYTAMLALYKYLTKNGEKI